MTEKLVLSRRETTIKLLIGCIVIILIFLAIGFLIWPNEPGYVDFRAHRSEYEAIVKEAKAIPLRADELLSITLRGRPVCIRHDLIENYLLGPVKK